MESRRLSLREQRILAEIEAVLRRDRKLDERLRNLRPPRAVRLLAIQRRLRGLELSLLLPATVLLLFASIRTAGTGLIIACSIVGAVTLLVSGTVLTDRIARRRRENSTTHESAKLTSPEQ